MSIAPTASTDGTVAQRLHSVATWEEFVECLGACARAQAEPASTYGIMLPGAFQRSAGWHQPPPGFQPPRLASDFEDPKRFLRVRQRQAAAGACLGQHQRHPRGGSAKVRPTNTKGRRPASASLSHVGNANPACAATFANSAKFRVLGQYG